MKRIRLFLFFVVFLLSSCSSTRYGNTNNDNLSHNLSHNLSQEQLKLWDNQQHLKVLEYNRNEVGWMESIDKMLNDTIYLIESHSFSDEVIPFRHNYSAIYWSKTKPQDFFSYSKKHGSKIKKSKEKLYYSNYELNMINNWDTTEIRKNTMQGGVVWLGGDTNILITRIIKNKNKKYIESIYCKGFLN